MSIGRRVERRRPGTKRDARREEIIRACAKLMREGGVLNTRLQDIAEHLGVAYTALYYYFRSRDQLVADVLIHTVELGNAMLDRAEGSTELERLMDYLARDILLDREFKVPPPPLYTLTERHRERVLKARSNLMRRVATRIEAGMREGSIRRCNPATAALALQNVVEVFYQFDDQIRSRAGSADPAVLTGELVRMLRHGLLIERDRPLEPSYVLERSDLLLGTRRGIDEGYDRLDDLLRTAIEAFNAEGAAASIPRMAERLGVSKTVYYRQFADKQDLLFLCYLRGIGVIEASRRIAELVARDTLDETLIHRHNLYRFHASEFGPFTALNAIDSLRDEQQRFVRHRNHGIRRASEAAWSVLRANGEIHDWTDPVIVQTIIGRLLYWLPMRHDLVVPDDPRAIATEHLDLLYRGLAPL